MGPSPKDGEAIADRPMHPDPMHPDPMLPDPMHPDPMHPDPMRPDPPRELPLVGAHVSTAGSLQECGIRVRRLGAEAVQVFPSNPRMWRRSAFGVAETALFGADLVARGIPLFVHTIYLINLASPDDDLREKSSASLADALLWGTLAGATAVVTHVGSHRGDGFDAGLTRVARALERAEAILRARAAEMSAEIENPLHGGRVHLGATPLDDARLHLGATPLLLVEGSAGGGDSLGRDAEELGRLVRAAPFPVGVCLDTAHLFASGIPVHTPDGVTRLLDDLGAVGCLDCVGLVHLNDSRTPFGSRRDRHENLWDGLLGRAGLMASMTEERLLRAPFVLEVPGARGHGPDRKNIRRARILRREAEAVRRSRGNA